MLPVKLIIRNGKPCNENGDYLVCETSELFLPLVGIGIDTFSEDRVAELRKDGPMQDCEIRKTKGISRFSGGILHLKLPPFTSASLDERRDCLRQCYRVILEKAVELSAKSIVLPFLGCLSVGFSFDDGVDVALCTIQDFIPLYNIAIKHDIYQQNKGKKKMVFSLTLSPRKSEDECVFKKLQPTIDAARSLKVECSGRMEKLSDLNGREQSYGCKHVIDLMLLRGGIEVDWDDNEKSHGILSMKVCKSHKQKLLTCWESNASYNRRTARDALTCSLPEIHHEGGVRPRAERRMNKETTLKLMEATGRFFFVGTALCNVHAVAIQNQKYDLLSFTDEGPKQHDNFMPLHELDNSLNEIASNLSRDKDPSFDNDQMEIDNESVYSHALDIPPPPEAYRDPKKERKRAFREFASLYDLSRLTGGMSWKELKDDTRRKKIASLIRLIDELCKECAGEDWEEMKKEVMKKIGLIVDSSRVAKILQTIDQRIEETSDKRERLSLVSIMTGHFSEKEIIHATGVSRYFIQEAKKFALYGLDEITNIRRARFNFPNLKKFVLFISRPEVMAILPKPARSLNLSSGESISLASVARLHSYRHVYAMFLNWLEIEGAKECAETGDLKEFVKKNSLGFTTCFKVMETVLPVKQVRMQCLDRFHAEALEAFDCVSSCVVELKETGRLVENEAADLYRRLRVAQNYLTGYYRMHLSESSECSSHCIKFALSDPSSPDYQSPCNHQHTHSCEQCNDILTVFAQFLSFLKGKWTEAVQKQDVARFRLKRMIDECYDAELRVTEFQKHILRSARSELDRISIINELQEHSALVTMDYSLKLMPTGFIETQSQWFGKAGISFHISHVQTKKGDKHLHHTLGHLNDDHKQDGVAVCVIGDHLFKILGENGITRVTLRSDNAANYRNAGVIYTLRITAAKYGVNLEAYIFSEPQSGKGVADNRISHAKGKLRAVVNSGGYGRDAQQIFKSLTTDPLLKAFSFYQIKGNQVVRAERTKKSGEGIPGITTMSSFRYEKDGIRVKKFDSVGMGKMISYEQQEEVQFDYEILEQGGYLSQSPEFWGEIAEKPTKRKDKKQSNNDSDEEDKEKKKFRCPDEMCTAKYRSPKGLSDHILLGKHMTRNYTDTVVEAAVKLFSKNVETNEDAYLSMKVDSFSASQSSVFVQMLTEGWAVKLKNNTVIIIPIVRAAVKKYFIERRSIQQRAEAKWVVKMIRNMKNPDGDYTYEFKFCIKESQAQGLITRWLKLEASKGLKAVEDEGKQNKRGEEIEDDEFCDDIEELPGLEAEPAKKSRSRSTTVSAAKKKQATRSISKKASAKSQLKKKKKNCDTSEGEETEDTEEEEDDEPVPSTAVRRSARSKSISAPGKARKECSRGSKENEEKREMSTSTRVLRSRKRDNKEEKINYCENEGDEEELDVFDAMMTTILSRDHYIEIYTDSE